MTTENQGQPGNNQGVQNQGGQQPQQGQPQQGQQQTNQAPPDDSSKPFNYRQLEQSRDSWQQNATKWQQQALTRTVKQAGFDPDKGVGSLLLESFARDNPDLDPDSLDETFQSYVEERGIQPDSQGEGGDGDGPTAQEQLLNKQQGQEQNVANMSRQPQGGNKSLQDQILEAQQAGDHEKANQLSMQLAAQQMVEAGRQ